MKRALQGLLGLAVGLGLALLYTWVISPVQYVDTSPNTLRADYQAAYAQLAARAYSVDGDLGRARTRLPLLGMPDPAQSAPPLPHPPPPSAPHPPAATPLPPLP